MVIFKSFAKVCNDVGSSGHSGRARRAVSSEYLRDVVLGDGLVRPLLWSVYRNELSTQPSRALVLVVGGIIVNEMD